MQGGPPSPPSSNSLQKCLIDVTCWRKSLMANRIITVMFLHLCVILFIRGVSARHPRADGHCSGRYASRWNAFLLYYVLLKADWYSFLPSTCIITLCQWGKYGQVLPYNLQKEIILANHVFILIEFFHRLGQEYVGPRLYNLRRTSSWRRGRFTSDKFSSRWASICISSPGKMGRIPSRGRRR